MKQHLSTNLLIGAAFGLSVAVALVLALPGASSATALAQISPQPTPTDTPTLAPDPDAPTPTPTDTPVPPTPTDTPVPPTPTDTPVPRGLTFAIGDITTDPLEPLVMISAPIDFTVVFTDPPPLSPSYTAVWDWGDGSSSICGSGSNPDDVSNSETCTITKQPETPEYTEYLVKDSHVYTDPGFYTVKLTVTAADGDIGISTVEITVLNQPPVCSEARSSIDSLWPPNHRFAAVTVLGVTDPDEDAVSITIDPIFQDEAVNAPGSGNTSPDGKGVGTSVAEIRAERAGGGNGRVYHIGFTAVDGHGGTCSGEVLVGVPKSRGKEGAPVDDGALYDSTVLAP